MTHTSPAISFTRIAAVAALLALTLTGCQAAAAPPAESPTEPPTATTDAPARIAALDYESAETLAELGLADRLVLIPEAVLNPALGGHIDELSQVAETIPVAMELNAESVIALAPDLVVMSPRHGADEKVGAVLERSGIETLVLPEVWSGVDSMITNIELIGEATASEDAAHTLVTQLKSGLVSQSTHDDPPRVLVLTNQAGKPFITAGSAFPLELLELSGAESLSHELGIQ
ncbi:MAG: ABC transporter substrate-binding protein, partial [Leucobacter sp.]|nr:ABC transporter substrate-binding protein [Leucobacter sp.]